MRLSAIAILLMTCAAVAETFSATTALPFTMSVAGVEASEEWNATTIAVQIENGPTYTEEVAFSCDVLAPDGRSTTATGRAAGLQPGEVRTAKAVANGIAVRPESAECRVTGFRSR